MRSFCKEQEGDDMAVDITVDIKQIDRASKEFIAFPKECKVAMVDAINRALSKGNTAIAKEVRAEYAVKTNKAVKSTLKVTKARKSNLNGEIKSEGKRLRMMDFPHKPQTFAGIGKQGKPFRVTIKKSAGEKQAKKRPKMFTPYKKGTRRALQSGGIYRKLYGNKFTPVYTLSVPQMIENEKVYKSISELMEETYYDRLYNHSLPALIAKAQAKIDG